MTFCPQISSIYGTYITRSIALVKEICISDRPNIKMDFSLSDASLLTLLAPILRTSLQVRHCLGAEIKIEVRFMTTKSGIEDWHKDCKKSLS